MSWRTVKFALWFQTNCNIDAILNIDALIPDFKCTLKVPGLLPGVMESGLFQKKKNSHRGCMIGLAEDKVVRKEWEVAAQCGSSWKLRDRPSPSKTGAEPTGTCRRVPLGCPVTLALHEYRS